MSIPASFTRIALVTGVRAEQDAFRPDLARRALTVSGLAVNEVEVRDPRSATVWCCTAGIGKVNGALAAATLITAFDPDLVAIIGTAGNISTAASISAPGSASGAGRLVLAPGAYLLTEAVHGDYGAYRDGGFVPYRAGTLPIGTADCAPFRSAVADAIVAERPEVPTARIVTGDSFVEDADRSRALAESSGAGLVDMETGAVAQVADRFGLPWLAVKAISDDANQDSASDFNARLVAASAQAARLFEEVSGLG